MRVAYIAAGAAGMYCGSCLHDNALAAALIRQGVDVTLVPTYTPLRTDEADVSIGRVFYGAVNVYLEQKTSLFRRTPWMLDRLLNSRGLLDWTSRRSASVDARELGDLTLSVLLGEDGKQSKELDKLVAWLERDLRPDVVHLTNSMFVGMARRLRERLGVPVLCNVQGEDLFIDDLPEPQQSRVRAALRERAGDVSAFVAPCRYYAGHMLDYLGVGAERVHEIPLGINLEGHAPGPHERPDAPFVVGYLARQCPEKGLHVLVDAFRRLAEARGADRVRLRIAGYLGARDRAYVDGLREQVESWGLGEAVEFLGEVDRDAKIAFLRSLHAFSVPTTYREPKGLSILEALANGVPAVQPAHGTFPQMLEETGGGVLCEPDDPADLAARLGELMDDDARRAALGRAGAAAVHERRNERVMAENTLKLYRACVENGG